MQPYAHNMKVFALVGSPLSAKGAQIEQFLVDTHNMKVIENFGRPKELRLSSRLLMLTIESHRKGCLPQGAQIEQFLVDAHNMKVIENLVRPKGIRLSSSLLTFTT